MRLREGSTIQFAARASELHVAEDSASRVSIELVRGSARYSVVPNSARAFEVHAGPVTVSVVGTEFLVERRGERAWVEVTRGKVRVSWGLHGQGRAFVSAGESGFFPPAAAPSPTLEEGAGLPREANPERSESDAPAARAQQASQAYHSHLARRDYRGAYAVLAGNPGLAGDTVKELLVAADVARLSNHPAEAVPYLQRIIREHSRDERAPMAAFTLGRTLSGLGRTQEAMNMFARVRSAWPNSPLGEDALLRQAEAAAKLGDTAGAVRIAEQYDRDYPNGRRRAEVRRYARLE
jgi:transmembrane sensor